MFGLVWFVRTSWLWFRFICRGFVSRSIVFLMVITRKRVPFAKGTSRSLSSRQVSPSTRLVPMVVCMSAKCRYEVKSWEDEKEMDMGGRRVAFSPLIF